MHLIPLSLVVLIMFIVMLIGVIAYWIGKPKDYFDAEEQEAYERGDMDL